MKRKFDQEIETLALKEGGNYLKTILTGETTILPDALMFEIEDQVEKSKRMRLSVVTEYMMMRIVECGFAMVKKEVEMVHGPIDVEIGANAQKFCPHAFLPDKEFEAACGECPDDKSEVDANEEEEKTEVKKTEEYVWMVDDEVEHEGCQTLGPFKTKEDAELVVKVKIHNRDPQDKDWKKDGEFWWKKGDRRVGMYRQPFNEGMANYKKMAEDFGIE